MEHSSKNVDQFVVKTSTLDRDIKVFCVAAKSFPDGILRAYQALHALVDFNPKRKYFGLSRPENGKIIYKAAAEELDIGELSKHHLEEFIIAKGNYIHIVVKNFMKNIPAIGMAFEKLIADKRLDPNGLCVEWYFNESDCQCMVRLKDN